MLVLFYILEILFVWVGSSILGNLIIMFIESFIGERAGNSIIGLFILGIIVCYYLVVIIIRSTGNPYFFIPNAFLADNRPNNVDVKSNVYKEIDSLFQLKEKGAITVEEYE